MSGVHRSAFLIGVDVGTSRVKAVALDQAGSVVTSAELPTPWERDGDGTAMDPAALGDVVLAVVGEAASPLPSPVAGIGVTGMAEAGVVTDDVGRPLAPIRAWHDQRADLRTLRAAVGEEAFRAATGMRLDAQPSLAKILQLRHDYPRSAAAVRFDSVPEWAVRCLGGTPGSELSLASRTGLLDVVSARPWQAAIDLLGADLLGEPRVAATPEGTVRGGGLPAHVQGAVLAVGGHDHQCAAFAAGAARDATLFDSLGTAEALLQFTRGPVEASTVADVARGPERMTIGLTVVEGHYCVMAGLRTGMKLETVASALGAADRRQRATLADAALAILLESGLAEQPSHVQGPDKFDATLQNPMLDAVAASKPDALLVAPNDVKASVPPLKRIQDAGTKIVLVDTAVDDATIGVSRIATNNELGGEKAAEALQALGVKAGAKVLNISVNPGISTTDARDQGFRKKATELGYKLVSDTQYSNNESSKAASIITAALAKDPDIAGVFASNLFTAQGVATGVKQAGKSGTVKVVGFDAGPDQIKQLQAGDVQALVAQKPFDIGKQGVEQAMAAMTGGSVTPKIETDSLVVTKDNMSQPDVSKYIYKSNC